MAKVEERDISLERHNFKLLLQALACIIFITSCISIALGVINGTFIPYENGHTYSLAIDSTRADCHHYTGVYLGLPGIFIGPLGLCLIGLLVPQKWAFRLAFIHLLVCFVAFIFDSVLADQKISACLTAQSEYLKKYYDMENQRKIDYLANENWHSKKIQNEFPAEQLPLATFVIIAAHVGLLVNAMVQIASYLLSSMILATSLGLAYYRQRTAAQRAKTQQEMETLEPQARHLPKE